MFELRPASEADYDFVWRVAATTMRDYVNAIWGWDEAWQEQRFRGNYSAAPWRVIVVDGQDAGATQYDRRPADGDLFLANIYLLPEFQRRGIGSAIVKGLMAEAIAANLPFALTVLKSNPDAKRLYERLGLRVVDENAERYFMSTELPGLEKEAAVPTPNNPMPSIKVLKSVAHNIAHHAQSFLSWLHPHMGEACRLASVTSADLELLRAQPYPLMLPRSEPLEIALLGLQTKFWEILHLTGLPRESVQSVRLEFFFSQSRTDDYSCAVRAVITASDGKIFDKRIAEVGSVLSK